MVVIRLSRGGSKARPFFNIVVADKRDRRDGRFIERIGFYNPLAKGAAESLRVAQGPSDPLDQRWRAMLAHRDPFGKASGRQGSRLISDKALP
jgi:hypothetical protein